MKILFTGSAGFIAGYVVKELLEAGHEVVGVDNFSKYGRVEMSFIDHPAFTFYEGDAKSVDLMAKAAEGCDIIVAAAAMIGGITYFHTHASDLMIENERIMATATETAIREFTEGNLRKLVVVSSSMVYESADVFPTPEGAALSSPPPISTYGFQKLACEYFAAGALEQYGLPSTIVRPFNCVGVGERRAIGDIEILSGNISLAMSHVVPDLVQKVLKGQKPLHILGTGEQVRHYTYGGDLAHGIRLAIEAGEEADNQAFNLSTDTSTTVLELAKMIWERINPGEPFEYVLDPAFEHDVQQRVPDTSKAREILGFTAPTTLEDMLDVVIPHTRELVEKGQI